MPRHLKSAKRYDEVMSYYEVLGIPATADDQEIVAAFRQRAQESLMDTEAYDLVQTAFETLKSPEKRKEYDATLLQTAEAVVSDKTIVRPGTAPLRRVTASQDGGIDDDSTRAFQPVKCAICGHQNAAGETYCSECGFLLSSAAGVSDDVVEAEEAAGPRLESPAGHIYPVKAGLNRVGRENADILVLDKTVSRYHALLVFDEERHLFSVEDAGSSNGTRVNGIPVPPRASHQLKDHDEISFGTTSFTVFTGLPASPAERHSGSSDEEPHVEVTMPPTSATPAARLTLQRGRGPQEVLLTPGTISIGRLPDNQISLFGDRYASGHHAQIVVEENIFRLIDVGSTNGSFLNGLRLTTNESIGLTDGDEIMIGSTVFQFQKTAPASEAVETTEADATLQAPIENLLPEAETI